MDMNDAFTISTLFIATVRRACRTWNATAQLVVDFGAGIVPRTPDVVSRIQLHPVDGNEAVVRVDGHTRDRDVGILLGVGDLDHVRASHEERRSFGEGTGIANTIHPRVHVDKRTRVAVFGEAGQGIARGSSEREEGLGVLVVGEDEEATERLLKGQVRKLDGDSLHTLTTSLAFATLEVPVLIVFVGVGPNEQGSEEESDDLHGDNL